MRKSLAVALLVLAPVLAPALTVPLAAQEHPQIEPVPARWQSHHSVQVGGETVEYDAIVGSVILRDGDDVASPLILDQEGFKEYLTFLYGDF